MNMIQTGNDRQRCGPGTGSLFPNMTLTEYKTEFSIWAISASHLILTAPIMDCGPTLPPPTPPTKDGCTVDLTDQISQAPCQLGKTFGCHGTPNVSEASIWLTVGCRGEFLCDGVAPTSKYCTATQSHGPLGSTKRFVCPCVAPAPPPEDGPNTCKPSLNSLQREVLFNKEVLEVNQNVSFMHQ